MSTPVVASRSTGGASSPIRRVAAALEEALREEDLSTRLRHAGTSVAFSAEGGGDVATLLLDREQPELVRDEPAEVSITLTPAAADAFADGRLSMPAAVITGDATATGPVRKYLEVDPIIRRVLADAAGTAAERPAQLSRAGSTPRLDPALLALETRGLHKAFGANQVLRGLDIQVPAGVISVVLGPSGTGKSVLLSHVIGLLRPDAGEVLIRERPLSRMKRAEILDVRSEIGVMFQDGALFSAMDVYDNVAFPLRQHTDLDEDEVREVVEEHLSSVGLLGAAHRMPNELSGGMRKRAGLARALALRPGIVLIDEPDSGLDPVRTALLGDLLVEQHARYGGTMLIVTHNVALARSVSEHITVVWRGQVLESGLSEDLFASETPFVKQFLSGASEGPLGMDA